MSNNHSNHTCNSNRPAAAQGFVHLRSLVAGAFNLPLHARVRCMQQAMSGLQHAVPAHHNEHPHAMVNASFTSQFGSWFNMSAGPVELLNYSAATSVPGFFVSGQSSGGSMAMQFLFAFSSRAEGVAIAGGSIYGCGDQLLPKWVCYGYMKAAIPAADKYAKWRHNQRQIDAPSNLARVPALLFNGKNDWLVYTAAMHDVHKQLSNYVNAGKLTTNFETEAGHVWSVDHGQCKCGDCSAGGGGAATTYSYASYSYGETPSSSACCDVNNCKFDLSGSALSTAYAPLAPRSTARKQLLWVKQTPYFPSARVAWTQCGMGGGACAQRAQKRTQTLMQWAILYVPKQCEADVTACKLHVNFHGCSSTKWASRRQWASELDLNEYAESNDMIIMYPQVTPITPPLQTPVVKATFARRHGPLAPPLSAMPPLRTPRLPPCPPLPPALRHAPPSPTFQSRRTPPCLPRPLTSRPPPPHFSSTRPRATSTAPAWAAGIGSHTTTTLSLTRARAMRSEWSPTC